jgi:NAD(P)-dependent dehydrogenase (short-subunit alcohol dehydrogenase family)
MRGAYPARPEQVAALIARCVSPENALMTGQVLFADGGLECLARGEKSW